MKPEYFKKRTVYVLIGIVIFLIGIEGLKEDFALAIALIFIGLVFMLNLIP